MVAIIIAGIVFYFWIQREVSIKDALAQKDLSIDNLFRACEELRVQNFELSNLITVLEHHQVQQDLRIGVLDYTSRKLEDILISLGEPYEHVLHRFLELEYPAVVDSITLVIDNLA